MLPIFGSSPKTNVIKSKESKRHRQVCHRLYNCQNITAETGERTLYVNIYKPNNEVLTKNAANTFEYENRSLPYSIKKYIEYNGEEQSITVFWNVEEYLSAGTYRVDIFADGTMIGSQRFELE